jgi:hypothetical protein
LQLVYYSLAAHRDSYCHRQWSQSIRSLRKYNDKIRVDLMSYDSCSPSLLDDANRCNVQVHHLGSYSDYLARLHKRAAALAIYPTLHKSLSLMHVPDEATQVLYLDCDTFFFGDVADLFSRHAECEFYAREEIRSRRNYMPYDPSYLDEDSLRGTAATLGLSFVEPFNTGVVLWNNGLWNQVNALRHCYLDFCWRLMVGRQLAHVPRPDYEMPVRQAVLSRMGAADWETAIPYPSRNPWLLDEVALWLTLGRTSMRQGYLDSESVSQSREYVRPIGRRVLSHYFGGQEEAFFKLFSIL